MRNNIHSIFRNAIIVLCCVSLSISLCVPAFAAPVAYEPYDYVSEVVNNGSTNRVTFLFADIPQLIDVWEQPSGKKTQQKNVTTSYTYKPNYDSITSIRFRIFLLGVEQWDNKPAIDGSVIDIGDIVPGETLDASMTFRLDVTRIYNGDPSDSSVGEYTLSGRYNFGFYTFDVNGQFISTKWGGASSSLYEFGVSEWTVYNPSYACSFDPSVRYICPFLDFEFSDTEPLQWWLFHVESEPFNLTCDVSAVHHDSATMQRIASHLSDIKNQVGDIQQGIGDMNGKLDDIHSGINGTNDRLDDVNQGIGDINDAINKDSGIDSGVADFGSAGDSLSEGMSGAVDSIEEGLGVVSGLTSSGSMTGTLHTISTAMAHAFSGRHQIYLCGLRFNPFNGWVLVFGGLALIGLVISYIFRKRGGK